MKFNRNSKCPCGSGKRFKRCHGHHPDGSPFVTVVPDGEFVLFRKEQDGQFFSKEALEGVCKQMVAYLMNCMIAHHGLNGLAPSRKFVKLSAKFDSNVGLPEGFEDLTHRDSPFSTPSEGSK